jgi:cytochrome c-type biogenesis protein CcmH/NrfF
MTLKYLIQNFSLKIFWANCFKFTLSLFLVSLNILICSVCLAEDKTTENKTQQAEGLSHKVSQSILSPFCPGRALSDCPSSSAMELRRKITDMALNGKSEEEIVSGLYAMYGEEIRAAPKKQGFGLLAWVMPLVFLIAGLIILTTWLSRKRATLPISTLPISDSISELDPAAAAKVNAEINKVS